MRTRFSRRIREGGRVADSFSVLQPEIKSYLDRMWRTDYNLSLSYPEQATPMIYGVGNSPPKKNIKEIDRFIKLLKANNLTPRWGFLCGKEWVRYSGAPEIQPEFFQETTLIIPLFYNEAEVSGITNAFFSKNYAHLPFQPWGTNYNAFSYEGLSCPFSPFYSNYTIVVGFQPVTLGSNSGIFSYCGFDMRLNSTNKFQIYNWNTAEEISSTDSASSSFAYHVAAAYGPYDIGTTKLYVDGILKSDIFWNNASFGGGDKPSFAYPWDPVAYFAADTGTSDFKFYHSFFWNRELTPSELSQFLDITKHTIGKEIPFRA